MQAADIVRGHILVTTDLQAATEELKERLAPARVVLFREESFKIEAAKAVMQEAYISESAIKYIVIAAVEFTTVAQNALLKILEEPPANIEFIVVTPNKANLLPTVRSRLPLVHKEHYHRKTDPKIRLQQLDYRDLFAFLKEHARISKNEAKALVEGLFFQATQQEKLLLSAEQLENFEKAYRLLDLNSRPQSVFAFLLMSFTKERG